MGVWGPSQGKQSEYQGHPYTSPDRPQAAIARGWYPPTIEIDATKRQRNQETRHDPHHR